MKSQVAQLNLIVAWLWIVLGFVAGFILGLNFHREDWLGGYASHKRRLYRLAHISFFGLALVNLVFYFTARELFTAKPTVTLASWGFIVGAVTMPLCCVLMAHSTKWRTLFAVPVFSLLTGGVLTLWEVLHL
ncbi:MAG: hypothetical protein HYY24_19200 [Verrucomicrobia bacterium]|nr:hypothetical protein [Verrucomicrobiota bacterium]